MSIVHMPMNFQLIASRRSRIHFIGGSNGEIDSSDIVSFWNICDEPRRLKEALLKPNRDDGIKSDD